MSYESEVWIVAVVCLFTCMNLVYGSSRATRNLCFGTGVTLGDHIQCGEFHTELMPRLADLRADSR